MPKSFSTPRAAWTQKTVIVAAAVCVAAVCAPAWAINKCTGADGKVTFQDAPCQAGRSEQISVRPASGHAEAPQPIAPGQAQPKSEAQRIESFVAESQKKRRADEYEFRIVPEAQQAVINQRRACDKQLQDLKESKRLASNNLAGATWEGSISTEMSAVATRCDTRNRELRDELENLRKECRALGGCK
ncbi:MAG: DUF4124 domain-containing protein [Rhodoferax sp.]